EGARAAGRAGAGAAGVARRPRLARRAGLTGPSRRALRAAAAGRDRVARGIAAAAGLENERERSRAQHRLNPNPLSHLQPSFLLAALRANPSPMAGFLAPWVSVRDPEGSWPARF